jgi:hypothetical protein
MDLSMSCAENGQHRRSLERWTNLMRRRFLCRR